MHEHLQSLELVNLSSLMLQINAECLIPTIIMIINIVLMAAAIEYYLKAFDCYLLAVYFLKNVNNSFHFEFYFSLMF